MRNIKQLKNIIDTISDITELIEEFELKKWARVFTLTIGVDNHKSIKTGKIQGVDNLLENGVRDMLNDCLDEALGAMKDFIDQD